MSLNTSQKFAKIDLNQAYTWKYLSNIEATLNLHDSCKCYMLLDNIQRVRHVASDVFNTLLLRLSFGKLASI